MRFIINLINRFVYGLIDLIGVENSQKVYTTARACGLNDTQAKIILSQAIHESAMFTSAVFKDDNNCFGIKMPSIRPKTYIAGASKRVRTSEGVTPYAHYNSVEDSVRDLILGWHKFNKTDWSTINTPAQYSSYLKSKGYYGAPELDYMLALSRNFAKLRDLT